MRAAEAIDLGGLPAATPVVEQAERDLEKHGIAILLGALSPAKLEEVRDALYHAAVMDRRVNRSQEDFMSDLGTQRVWNLPSRDPVFCELVEHPVALRFVKKTLGWPVALSNISANITKPGSGEMVLHADQSLSPPPWAAPHALNIIWCVDDFTEEAGATRVVPGSHELNRAPKPHERDIATVAVEAPAGCMVAMDGRMWHKTGANRSKARTRAGIFGYYTLPIFMPQENWWLSLDPAVRQFGSDTLLQLFGLKPNSPMGLVNGLPVG